MIEGCLNTYLITTVENTVITNNKETHEIPFPKAYDTLLKIVESLEKFMKKLYFIRFYSIYLKSYPQTHVSIMNRFFVVVCGSPVTPCKTMLFCDCRTILVTGILSNKTTLFVNRVIHKAHACKG